MIKLVRFNVINKNPACLEVNDQEEIYALDNNQIAKLNTAVDKFLDTSSFDDNDFFCRAVDKGVIYFYIPPSGTQSAARPLIESVQ